VGHVARVVIGETGTELLLENVKERDYLEKLGVDGSTMFKNVKEIGWDRLGYIHVFQGKCPLGITISLRALAKRNMLIVSGI
jgi:hypothetical protein